MNEITKIHLGRQAYTIAVDAYKVLQSYLHEIKREVGESGPEVAAEVEVRMAELLAERGIKEDKVILLEDVEYLKSQLGSPRDFKGEDDTDNGKSTKADAEKGPKRLFRDTERGMLAGVCAGIANYIGIDVTIVRLLFAALLFFGGGGILLYIVLWLVVPEAKTTSDRLQMQGKPVTVDTLKDIAERADVAGAAQRAQRSVAPFVQALAKLVLAVLGVMCIAVALATLIGLATAVIYLWTNNGVWVAGEKLLPYGTQETLLLVGGLILAAVLALFFTLTGMAMISRKWKTPGWAAGALGGVFLLALAAVTGLALNTAPRIRDRALAMNHVSEVSVQPFKKLVLSGPVHYTFQMDSTYKVEYQYIGKQQVPTITEGADGTLTIDGSHTQQACNLICGYDRDLTVVVHAPGFESMYLKRDVVSFDTDSTTTPGHFSLNADRYGGVTLSTNTPCSFDKPLVTLDAYPIGLVINDTALPLKTDLTTRQDSSKPSVMNCVAVLE